MENVILRVNTEPKKWNLEPLFMEKNGIKKESWASNSDGNQSDTIFFGKPNT
jgi:hypothetical protein